MSDIKEITTEDLKKWIDEGKEYVLLDVLAPASYEARHIPTAKSAPGKDSDFLEKVASLIPSKDTPVIAYCSSAQCGASPQAAARLVKDGYTDVHHYKEGLAGWQNAGYSFEGPAA